MTTPPEGHGIGPPENQPAPTAPGAKPINPANFWFAVAVLAFCVVAGIVGALKDDSLSGSNNGNDAERVCYDFVRDRLRSPSSAVFSNVNTSGSGSTFTVSGAVDSQNGFGAMIRNSFTCSVRLDGDTWHLSRMDGLAN